MTEAVFVLSKHPFGRVQDGETRITRLLLEAAAQSCEVRVVALTNPADAARPDVVEVAKPPVRLARLAATSIARRRSLIHLRFAPSSLRRALAEIPADVLVARRLYMAEAAIDAGRIPPATGSWRSSTCSSRWSSAAGGHGSRRCSHWRRDAPGVTRSAVW